MSDAPETAPPPEANERLIGHMRAEGRILEALRSARLHHAWLISGPRGIGKATLAFRFARFLLAHGGAIPPGADSLHVPPEHPAFHTIAAGAHPDLFTLRRGTDPRTGRLRAVINVEDARRAAHFLSMTAAGGGWRVVVVDTADEMNAAAANAILKILEEPPPRSVFLMVSHSPGRLLPTVRSRCLHLPVRPLTQEQTRETLALLDTGLDPQTLGRAAALSGGSPGRALELATSKAAEFFTRFLAMTETPGGFDVALTHQIARAMAPPSAAGDFALFCSLLEEWMQERARAAAKGGNAARAREWAELASGVAGLLGRVEALNLDRRQALSALFAKARAAARPA